MNAWAYMQHLRHVSVLAPKPLPFPLERYKVAYTLGTTIVAACGKSGSIAANWLQAESMCLDLYQPKEEQS